MLGAATPFLTEIWHILEAVLLVIVPAGAIFAGIYYFRAQKAGVEANRAQEAIASLEAAMNGQTVQMETMQSSITHLEETVATQDATIKRQATQITALNEQLTQRAAVEEFREETRKWFLAISIALQEHGLPVQIPTV